MRRKSLIAVIALSVAACGDAVSPDSALAGAWTYAGTQDAPASAELDGTVTWHGVASAATAFEGTFAVIERQANGSIHTISGPGAGQLLSDSIADFDLTVNGVGRRHIGVLRGDSISGSWAVLSAGQTATGHFVLRRNS